MRSRDDAQDRAEIRDLLPRLARFADEAEIADYLDLYTADAVWEIRDATAAGAPPQRRAGRAEIEAGVVARRSAGGQGPGSSTRHVITTVDVVAVGDTEATASAYWLFYTDTDTSPKLAAMGAYDDTFRRTPQGWRLAHRVIRSG